MKLFLTSQRECLGSFIIGFHRSVGNGKSFGDKAVKESKLRQSLSLVLKEYSVILTMSFYDINQKILRKKSYFQNFS